MDTLVVVPAQHSSCVTTVQQLPIIDAGFSLPYHDLNIRSSSCVVLNVAQINITNVTTDQQTTKKTTYRLRLPVFYQWLNLLAILLLRDVTLTEFRYPTFFWASASHPSKKIVIPVAPSPSRQLGKLFALFAIVNISFENKWLRAERRVSSMTRVEIEYKEYISEIYSIPFYTYYDVGRKKRYKDSHSVVCNLDRWSGKQCSPTIVMKRPNFALQAFQGAGRCRPRQEARISQRSRRRMRWWHLRHRQL